MRWLLKKRTNGSVRYCQYTSLNNSSYMWNILIYAIPYTLYALAAGFLVTFFSVPNVRINIRKYRDIPAEMSYAPGEHIKGGQE
ncbi:hypothetical protein [Escherichia coli]|uniref:hypothetical protein n=1 Tax=Escherichia coli TaxID=562 RepID=UPI00201A7184|nr:hypothetical protein [Escherichia coli]